MYCKPEIIVEIKKEWIEKGVCKAVFTFSCGGDSMGDTDIGFFDEADRPIQFDREDDFNSMIYDNITFYDSSDGYYEGESGEVTVILEDGDFCFNKDAQSEYNETKEVTVKLDLQKKVEAYIKEYVRQFGITDEASELQIIYKKDFIYTEEHEEIEELLEEIVEHTIEHSIPYLSESEEFNEGGTTVICQNPDLSLEVAISYIIRRYEQSIL